MESISGSVVPLAMFWVELGLGVSGLRGNFDIHSYGTKILDSLGPPEGRKEKSFLHILGDAFSRPGQFWPKELKVENTRASHSLYSIPHTQNCGYCDM